MSSFASAQDSEARLEFERGMALGAEGRYVEAIPYFRRALSHVRNVPIAFNLAIAVRAAGGYLEAEALLVSIIDGQMGPIPDGEEPRVIEQLQRTRDGIAVLEIEWRGIDPISIAVDGEPVEFVRPLEVRMDPGLHVIVGTIEDLGEVRRELDLQPGQRERILWSIDDVSVPQIHTSTSVSDTTIPRRRGLWIGLSVGLAVAVACAVAIPLVVSGGADGQSASFWGTVRFPEVE